MTSQAQCPLAGGRAWLGLLLAAACAVADASPVVADFDGDGASDLFWRNSDTGGNALWRAADRATQQAVANVTDPAWRVVGAGDFDGDGHADLLWRHRASGQDVIWPSGNRGARLVIATVADPGWTVAGVGDFDGDGRSDIFWRYQSSGANVLWPSALRGARRPLPAVPTEWVVAGVGDFDQDGRADVVWRNTRSGADAIWRAADKSDPQAMADVADPAWKIVGIGDFDGDGRSDVFWRNTGTGANVVWPSANRSARWTATSVTSQDWQVAAIGDYDRDGRQDLLWRNARTGANVAWPSALHADRRQLVAVPDPVWQPVPGGGQSPAVAGPAFQVSASTPFTSGCDGQDASGAVYANAEVEPTLAVNPRDSRIVIGAWQQDRWSNGSARGIIAAYSSDGGASWTRRIVPFSRCGGGRADNGGDYARTTDPWLAYSPGGTAYLMALSATGGVFAAGSSNAMLVSRSLDNGHSWSAPVTLIRDGANAFNDKNTITADPNNALRAYAVWDRLTPNGNGPVYFSRTSNGGGSWTPARAIYNPGGVNQTIGNVIVGLPDGALVDLFTEIDTHVDGSRHALLAVIRSTDKGLTWSAPIHVADNLSVGTRDPHTGRAVRDSAYIGQIAVAPGGKLYVAWQDGRFSNGKVDGIALSRSSDGGRHWTSPVRINPSANVAAFVPSVHVRSDGAVGVSYFDFRSDTAATTSLWTEAWLAWSDDDGVTWRENRISSRFDLDTAPNADGYFLGDYQGLSSRGAVFVPFFARAGTTSGNRTDILAAPVVSAASDAAAYHAAPAPAPTATALGPAFRQRIQHNLEHLLREHAPPPRREPE
ncbi:FG-GAP-like repeat-containing protein [Cognatiluteimonas telluris]|uniref:FG-GAP-like repeat-containing protein n=1 Tax=Cognatiluteimonas telluris TaxID=1104775 RepID=UPI00140952E7|nr:FG-GAP-like repeat-containing protein [Lysobacter telluris]